MTVAEDVARVAGAAAAYAEPGEELAGVLVAETLGRRVYLCAFESAAGRAWPHSWWRPLWRASPQGRASPPSHGGQGST